MTILASENSQVHKYCYFPIRCSYRAKHREGDAKLLNHSPHNRHLYRSCDSHVSLARGVVRDGDEGLAADLTISELAYQ